MPQATMTDPGETMTPAPGTPNDFQPIGLLILLVVALCVKYWPMALRLIAIAIITLAIYGAVLLAEALHTHP
jgi:hypothetical protein